MNKQCFNIAKITKPDSADIYERSRLSKRLQQSGKFSLTWVSGPPGSGKTISVSSFIAAQEVPCIWYNIDSSDTNLASFYYYLTLACRKAAGQGVELPDFASDKNDGLPEFSRNFFTGLFNKFNDNLYLVLDNYQEVPEDIPLHELLLDTLEVMPQGVHLIIISRREPSAKFSRLALNRKMDHIDWQDLRFTKDEFKQITGQWGYKRIPRETLDTIYNKMDGWVAGLLFMLADKKKYNKKLKSIGTGTFDKIHRYFTEEIFAYQDSDIKHFLLAISVLPAVTAKHAREITGMKNSGKILSQLDRNNFYVDKLSGTSRDAYILHPLFKEYLNESLADYLSPGEITDLKRRAAALLSNDNQVEDAADLLISAEDWDGLIDIIGNQAELLLGQGRIGLINRWCESIPLEKMAGSPWLSYWWGKSLQPKDLEKAKAHFITAFEGFRRERDLEGSFGAWVGQVDTIIIQWNDFTELDPLIDWLEENFDKEDTVLSADLKLQIATCMVSAMNIRRPESPTLAEWVEYCADDAKVSRNIELSIQAYLVIANYYLWRGDQSNCWILLGRIRNLCSAADVSTLSVLKSKCLEATMYAWFLSDGTKCLDTVKQALGTGKGSGIHTMDHRLYVAGAYGALIEKNYMLMADYLQKMEILFDNTHQHNYFCHNYLSAWLSIFRHNFQRGLQHANEAAKTAQSTGFIYHEALGLFAQTQVFFEKGDYQGANKILLKFRRTIDPLSSQLLQYLYLLTKAQISMQTGKEEVGLKFLRKGMKLGREENYQRLMCWWNPATLTNLCIQALDNDIETDYVQELINIQGLVPEASPIEIEQWPWPMKIYSFGRFEIVKNGKPVRSSGKAQQKPLAMLKAIISLGGRNVAEVHLAEALWPEADGDMQHQALATTLHRLRRLLGGKEMVEFNDGHISLNSRCCWVDIWAFERLLSRAEVESRKKEMKSSFYAARYAEKAVNIYKGNFLPQNVDHWSIHMREKLKSRFLRGVSFLGRNLEKIGEREKAVSYYMQALEIDHLVEEFYQRLMICYHRMDRNADAVLVFRRCLKNFDKALKISPSTQTRALYKNLLAKQYSAREKDAGKEKKLKYVNNL